MKKALSVILAVVMLIMLIGCASAPKQESTDPAPAAETPKTETPEAEKPAEETAAGDEIVITWGIYETDNLTAELWDYVISEFEADNPGIKVEKVLATGDNRPAFWKTLSASGNFPDIVLEAENLAQIPGLFAELPEDIYALFDEATLCTYEGKCVTIPYMKQLRMQCYYNLADFAECGLSEPTTYEEFLNVCDTLKAAGKTPLICAGSGDVWATGQPWWISVSNQTILAAYPDFNEQLKNGTLRWDDPVIIEDMHQWQELVNAGYYHEGSMSYSYSQAASEFQNGAATMMIDGSWAAAGFDAAGNTDFGVFVVPQPSGAQTYCAANSYWGVHSGSKNLEAAWQFIRWFFSTPEVYGKVLAADGLYSTTKEPVSYEQGALMTKFVENLEDMTLVPEIIKVTGDYAVHSATEGELNKSLQNIFIGKDAATEMAAFQDLYDMMGD